MVFSSEAKFYWKFSMHFMAMLRLSPLLTLPTTFIICCFTSFWSLDLKVGCCDYIRVGSVITLL